MASVEMNLEARSTHAQYHETDRQDGTDRSREKFERAFIAACINYMSRKLRIIWWPPSVSTLSG
jgi:hypothetical protein